MSDSARTLDATPAALMERSRRRDRCVRLFLGVGFTVCLLVSNGLTQPDGSRRPWPGRGRQFRESLAAIALLPDVQKDLKLNEDQQELVLALQIDLHEQARNVFGLPSPVNDATEFSKIREKFEAIRKAERELMAIILDSGQFSRVGQIQLQLVGLRAFDRDDFVKRLKLNDEQSAQIAELRKSRELRVRNRADRISARARIKEQIRGVLTDDQRSTWDSLLGKPIELPGN